MIIQVRGGGGSGKSTLVRRWVEDQIGAVKHMMSVAPYYGLGHIDCAQSRPFAIQLPHKKTVVPGHYEAPGGGCDMIKSVYHINEVVRTAVGLGFNVLMEGLFVSKDAKATLELLEWAKANETPVVIILIDIEEQEAYDSIQARRKALGKEERFLKSHRSDFRAVHTAMLPYYKKWEEQGLITFYHLSREAAAAKVEELLP